MRTAKPIVLDAVSRLEIERNARGRPIAARVVMRSRIILLAAKGLQNLEIAQQMKIAPRTVHRWRERFLDRGIVGLLKDAPRPGRTPSIPAETVAQVIEKTTQSKPVNATHWSRSTMAREMGISDSSVVRIWQSNSLKPHRIDSFKISNDPQFAEKLDDIVGLYLNTPEHALVLSLDEKARYKPWTAHNQVCR